jgi:hypothetical protein
MDSPGLVSLLAFVLALPGLWVAFLLVRAARMAVYRHLLGKQWNGRRLPSGREAWTLVSPDGRSLDRIRRTPAGRWTTEWGREFTRLTEAAKWVETKHPS